MFSRFETEDGALYVRNVDIRDIRDVRWRETTLDAYETHAIIDWETTQGRINTAHIKGTADENMARLRQEESEALQAAERLRQNAMRVERGKQPMSRAQLERLGR